MKRVDKARTNNTQPRRPVNIGRRDQKPQRANGSKPLNAAQLVSRVLDATAESRVSVSDSTTGSESSEVYENLVVHYIDDAKSSEEARQESSDDRSRDLEKHHEGNADESDSETNRDSVSSSQGDSFTAEDERVEKASRVIRSKSSPDQSCASKTRSDSETTRLRSKTTSINPKKSPRASQAPGRPTPKNSSYRSAEDRNAQDEASLGSSGVVYYDYKPVEEVKEDDVWEDALNGGHSAGSDNELVDAEENIKNKNKEILHEKIETMATRIEKLEGELREVAALEISLYSVAPEHGSSAHKLHTPARRLSRLYIHASKFGTQNTRATIARNTVSGLVFVSKSCGSDVSRLMFWLSNTIILREIISQAFGSSHKQKDTSSSRHVNGLKQLPEDWKDTGTFLSALGEIECWIFTQVVDSVWGQVLTPRMKSRSEDSLADKSTRKLLGPALGDQQQGIFSINLWNNAFQEALQRLCPIRAARQECGCLPVLARMVMEQCIARLDVAMFNAILRESAHQVPTDPVSDPIADSKALPIPAGDLSFGSGAQLKNAVGNWSRCLTDMFGIDANDSLDECKPFCMLNELSDLLMLPKDMLMDRSIREEVCPSIGLTLIKRILCNFTPDEFCPDHVPGVVLEELNAECIVERRLFRNSDTSFPHPAAAVLYNPPSCADVAEKVAEAGGESYMSRNVSRIQRKGYNSDEELEEMDSPLTSIIGKVPSSPNITSTRTAKHNHDGMNVRYELLREVWSA